jgi:hypothetical protein
LLTRVEHSVAQWNQHEHPKQEGGGLSSLLAKISLLDLEITNPFAEEVITHTQPLTDSQPVQKNYKLHSKIVQFETRVQEEERAINELRREYDKILADIMQFAHKLMPKEIQPVPHAGVNSAAQVHSTFDAQIKVFGREIEMLGGDLLAQLEVAKMKAVRKKRAVLEALTRLERD